MKDRTRTTSLVILAAVCCVWSIGATWVAFTQSRVIRQWKAEASVQKAAKLAQYSKAKERMEILSALRSEALGERCSAISRATSLDIFTINEDERLWALDEEVFKSVAGLKTQDSEERSLIQKFEAVVRAKIESDPDIKVLANSFHKQ